MIRRISLWNITGLLFCAFVAGCAFMATISVLFGPKDANAFIGPVAPSALGLPDSKEDFFSVPSKPFYRLGSDQSCSGVSHAWVVYDTVAPMESDPTKSDRKFTWMYVPVTCQSDQLEGSSYCRCR